MFLCEFDITNMLLVNRVGTQSQRGSGSEKIRKEAELFSLPDFTDRLPLRNPSWSCLKQERGAPNQAVKILGAAAQHPSVNISKLNWQ